MSDDLVKRLRDLAAVERAPTAGALKKAADRIEKLETALRKVCEDWDSPKFNTDWEALVEICGVFGERKRIARKALDAE
jgi:hypothetical protein